MNLDMLSMAVGVAAGAGPAVMAGSALASIRWRRTAMTDALTGVWTRRGLPRVGKVLAQRTACGPVAVIQLDVRHFKTINDTHGHDAGDAVLQHIAARLRNFDATAATPVRLGGDEFAAVITLQSHHRGQSYPHQVHRLYTAVTGSVSTETGSLIDVDVTIGAAIAHRGDTDLAGLLTAADTAMYAARRHSESLHIVYGGLPTPATRPARRRRDTTSLDPNPVTVTGGAA